MIDEQDNKIEEDLSYNYIRVNCNNCGKDFIHILEGIKHALSYNEAQKYIENRWNMKKIQD